MSNQNITASVRDGKIVLTPNITDGLDHTVNVEIRANGQTINEQILFSADSSVVVPSPSPDPNPSPVIKDFEYTIEPSNGEQKAGKPITVVFTSELNGNSIAFSKTGNTSVYKESDGKTFTIRSTDPITDQITFTCTGFNDLTIPVEFVEGDVLSFSYSPSKTVTKDVPVEITVSGTTEQVTVENDDPRIATVTKQSDYVFLVKPLKAGTINLIFRGNGVKEVVETVVFEELDTLSVQCTPSEIANAETPIEMIVSGTSRSINVVSSNESVATVSVSDYTITVTPTGKVGYTDITISGTGINTYKKKLTFTAVPPKPMECTVTPSNTVVQGNSIVIEVTSELKGCEITATAKNGSRIVKDPNGTTFTVTNDYATTETITLSGSRFITKTIDLEFTLGVEVQNTTVVADSGTETDTTHEDERLNLKIPNDGTLEVAQFRAVSSDTSVATVKYELTTTRGRSARASTQSGKVIINPVGIGTADITVTGPGIQPIVKTVTFTEAVVNPTDTEITATVEPVGGNVEMGETIKITTDVDLNDAFTIIGDTNNISFEIDNQDSHVLNVTSAVADTTTIKIVKAGFKTISIPVVFLDPNASKDSIVYKFSECCSRASTNSRVALMAYYNSEKLKLTCSDKQVVIKEYAVYPSPVETEEGYKNVIVSEYMIESSTEGVKQFTLTGSDNKTTTFSVEFFDDEVNEYMELEKKKLELMIGEEKYILSEVANEDSEIKVTSKAITEGNIEYRQEANRIYIKGINPGTYFVKVEHPRYKNSTFQVVVKNQQIQAPVTQSEREYYDLGTAPQLPLSGVNRDNFISKVNAESVTDAQKVAYILSKTIEYPNYAQVANQLCKANQSIVSNDFCMRKSGAALVASTLTSVLNISDYITFKQTMLLVKLVFSAYRTTGLSEDSIKINTDDNNKYEFVSDMCTFIEKDIAGQLSGLNVKAMSKLIDNKAKERLMRYVHEA